jgi:cytochrome P450
MTSVPLLAQAPGALPLLGHALPMLRDPLRFLRSLPSRGDLVEIRIGPIKALVVCDPDLTRQVLLDDRAFDKGGPFFDRARETLGNGLLTCPHRDHRRQRRLIQPLFHPSRFSGYTQAMLQEITAVTGAWRDGQTLDVPSEMMKISTRVTLALILGSTLPPATLTEMTSHLTTVATTAYKRMFLRPPLDRVPLPSNRRYIHAITSLRTMLAGLIQDRRANRTDHADLLSILLATSHTGEDLAGAGHDKPALSDSEIIDQVITFFIAGAETAASTLAWALELLARHPDIQRRLHAEVDALPPGPTRFDDLSTLALTQQVLTETLRLYPPSWLSTRKTTSDSHLGAHPVPAATTLIYSPYLIHHRPDLYPDPDRFDPDRWANHTSPRHAFVPFGGGARKCIGDTFALAEATLVLATITAHWTLHPRTPHPPRPTLGGALRPQRCTLRLTSRPGLLPTRGAQRVR